MFEKILIANRGEVAVRVIRACREMGIATVAVYSEVDVGALHVRMADEAYPIGRAPSRESYLSIERMMNVAARSGADAVHPGYGFLAENAAFASACEDTGITFVGPSPASIMLMGSKVESRRTVIECGVEVVPGTVEPITSNEEAREVASRIEFPVMVKASAGGGGKGLRMVRNPVELEEALERTRSEALAAFGDNSIYFEKCLTGARHVEIQVLADRYGSAVHLGERECTIQRRHQKVIEEAPSPIVDSGMRSRMGEAALKVVRAVGYYNAGTVEFLVDADRRFYFLEMNTRLQVEHAVTESVTGIDLVNQQIRIASGEKLAIQQDEVVPRGSAIECRIYAEDPTNNFLPSPGTITLLRSPSGPGVRDDSGVYEGYAVPIEYDPLISKLVAWAPTRPEAIQRMKRALSEYVIGGIKTNIGFFSDVLGQPDFEAGSFDAAFIDRWLEERSGEAIPVSRQDRDLAVLAAVLFHDERKPQLKTDRTSTNPWKMSGRPGSMRQL